MHFYSLQNANLSIFTTHTPKTQDYREQVRLSWPDSLYYKKYTTIDDTHSPLHGETYELINSILDWMSFSTSSMLGGFLSRCWKYCWVSWTSLLVWWYKPSIFSVWQLSIRWYEDTRRNCGSCQNNTCSANNILSLVWFKDKIRMVIDIENFIKWYADLYFKYYCYKEDIVVSMVNHEGHCDTRVPLVLVVSIFSTNLFNCPNVIAHTTLAHIDVSVQFTKNFKIFTLLLSFW